MSVSIVMEIEFVYSDNVKVGKLIELCFNDIDSEDKSQKFQWYFLDYAKKLRYDLLFMKMEPDGTRIFRVEKDYRKIKYGNKNGEQYVNIEGEMFFVVSKQ